jgi:outer membrane phospholipase A
LNNPENIPEEKCPPELETVIKHIVVACLMWILSAVGAAAAEAEKANARSTAHINPESMRARYHPCIENIGVYKPIYFLMGTDPEDSRFQISFKYRLFGDNCPLAATHPWITGLNLGYTQASSWDLASDSAPFEDTSYMPEVFFLSRKASVRPRLLDGLYYQAGILHESNGQGGVSSRSTNYFYFGPRALYYHESANIGLQIMPKLVWFFNNSDDTNPGVEDYRGNLELELKAGIVESFVLDADLRFASRGQSLTLNITYPFSMFFLEDLGFYLQLQYANTLAETLLDYKARTEAIRFGLSLVR